MPRNGFGRLALMKLWSYVKEALDPNAVPCSAAVESNIMRTAAALLLRCTEDEKAALGEGGEIPEWLGFEEVAELSGRCAVFWPSACCSSFGRRPRFQQGSRRLDQGQEA